MNGKKARRLRKIAYGDGFIWRPNKRKYKNEGHRIVAEPRRHAYQQLKNLSNEKIRETERRLARASRP